MVVALVFLARLLLVALFLPFSALGKLLNFDASVQQAGSVTTSPVLAKAFIIVGLSEGRETFWDFMKNLAVARGFLMHELSESEKA